MPTPYNAPRYGCCPHPNHNIPPHIKNRYINSYYEASLVKSHHNICTQIPKSLQALVSVHNKLETYEGQMILMYTFRVFYNDADTDVDANADAYTCVLAARSLPAKSMQ